MPYVLMLITCIVIGVLAQVKGRPGAQWAAITATVLLPTWFCCSLGAAVLSEAVFDRTSEASALATVVSVVIGALMGGIVATRPAQDRAMPDPMRGRDQFPLGLSARASGRGR